MHKYFSAHLCILYIEKWKFEFSELRLGKEEYMICNNKGNNIEEKKPNLKNFNSNFHVKLFIIFELKFFEFNHLDANVLLKYFYLPISQFRL